MDQNSKQLLEAQLRECFGRVVWTHKIQEKSADIALKRDNQLKLFQIFLSALTTTGLVTTIFGDVNWVKITSAIVSAVLLLLNTYLKSKDYGAIAQKHADAAVEIWNMRESYLSLITDLRMKDDDIDVITKRRDKLQEKLASIYRSCPRTSLRAYYAAKKALKIQGEMSISDETIDGFLPMELRKTNI